MKILTEILNGVKNNIKISGKNLIVYSSMVLALTGAYACGGSDSSALLAEADSKCKQWANKYKCTTKGQSCNELAAAMYERADNWDGVYGKCVERDSKLFCAPVCDHDGKCNYWLVDENSFTASSNILDENSFTASSDSCELGNAGGTYETCKAGNTCGDYTQQ